MVCGHQRAVALVPLLVLWASLVHSRFSGLQAYPDAAFLEPASHLNQEECLRAGLSKVLNSCSGYEGSTGQFSKPTSNMRDEMIRLLQSCLLANGTTANQNMTMKFLLPASYIADRIVNVTSVYQQTTGIGVEMVLASLLTQYFVMRPQSINNPANRSVTHDAWLITPSGTGDGVAAEAFMDLSQLVLYDQRLQWQGIVDQVRLAGLVYGSKVVALPISAFSFSLFYRMDTFRVNNWTVPKTWRELVRMSRQINGTNNMWGFCGGWGLCVNLGTNLFRYILASHHQTLGVTHGWLIDPDTMKLMLDSPAVKETLDILQELRGLSPADPQPGNNCSQALNLFVQGQCHMTMSIGSLFKFVSHNSTADFAGNIPGNLGTALLPGSSRVLDRATNTWVSCNEQICPYAVKATVNENGTETTVWVNQSPALEASQIPINAQSPSTIQFYAFSLTSYLARPEISDQLVFDPVAEALPTRWSQLQPSRWQLAGYNGPDAAGYCAVHSAALSHPNMHVQLRIPGTTLLIVLFGQLAGEAIQGNSTAMIAASAQEQGNAILAHAFKDNSTAFKLAYWSSLNRMVPPAAPPPGALVDAPGSGRGRIEDDTKKQITIALAVVLPVVFLVVVALTAWRAWPKGRVLVHQVPGVGPNTTLLVTDIENSTSLWEAIEPSIMEQAGRLHDSIMRKVMAKHKGYETFWEGDSFVVGFPTPLDALHFSLQVHKALLHADWPAALLAHECAKELWVSTVRHAGSAHTDASQAATTMLQPSSPPMTSHASFMTQDAIPDREIFRSGSFVRPEASQSSLSQFFRSGSVRSRTSASGAITDAAVLLVQQAGLGPDSITSVGSGAAGTEITAVEEMAESSFTQIVERIPSARITTDQGEGLVPFVMGAKQWALKDKWARKWHIAQHQSGSDKLVFRGLRVRIGMHSGVTIAPEFNKNNRRYMYPGAIRVVANAVASAGHGGFIMISTATALQLGMESDGVLKLLPSDCHIYHMGNHVLSEVPGDPMELMLILPASMKSILAIQQTPLRTKQCVVSGVLYAPAEPPSWALDMLPEPVLAAVQFVGLAALLAWDKELATDAIRSALQAVNAELADWQGVMSEDGLSLVLQTGNASHSRAKARFGDVVVPGRVVAAFHDAGAALKWALVLRHRLANLEWSEELLRHELCEKVGTITLPEANMVNCTYRKVPLKPGRLSLLRSEFGDDVDPEPSSCTRSFVSQRHEPEPGGAELQGRVSLPLRSSDSVARTASMTQLPHITLELHSEDSLGGSSASGVARAANTADPTRLPPRSKSETGAQSPGLPRDFGNTAIPPMRRSHTGAMRHVQVLPSVPEQADATKSGKLTEAIIRRHAEMTGGAAAQMPGISGRGSSCSTHVDELLHALAQPGVYLFDATLLRGLRVEMALASGSSSVHIATKSSGRATYRGPAAKQLHKLLHQARAGQVLVTGKVMRTGVGSRLSKQGSTISVASSTSKCFNF